MSQTPLTTRRWSRLEYEQLAETGFFDDDPVELMGGQLVVCEPKGTYHVTVMGRVHEAVRAPLPPGWIVRDQAPIALGDDSAPEPDLAVVPGGLDDYLNAHPSVPALVIEVADASLSFDRKVKGSLYARGGIRDYWIVNVVDRVLEVYREPQPDASAVYGWSYGSLRTVRPVETVTPLALAGMSIPVAALLPRGGV